MIVRFEEGWVFWNGNCVEELFLVRSSLGLLLYMNLHRDSQGLLLLSDARRYSK